MKLLLKREQTTGRFGRVQFRLWAKFEIDDDEKELMKRYKFDQALLMGENQPKLMQTSIILGTLAAIMSGALIGLIMPVGVAAFLGLLAGGSAGYWYFNEKRDEIFVQDLLHGRHFKCPSIIDLTKKEALVSEVSAIFRQVMESAKQWGGTQTDEIPVLSREEARELILKAF